MVSIETLQIWIGAMFTVFIYTFAIRDNKLYRFTGALMVGSAAGFATVSAINNIRNIAFTPLMKGQSLWIIPIILGLTLFFRFTREYSWVNRYGLSVIVSIGTALTMTTVVNSQILAQIKSSFLYPYTTDANLIAGSVKTPFNNIIVIVIVITSVLFFVFSGGTNVHRSKSFGYIRTIGLYSMMIAFGATFGNTMMSRIAEMSARMFYVLSPEAIPILPVTLILCLIAFLPIKKLLGRE